MKSFAGFFWTSKLNQALGRIAALKHQIQHTVPIQIAWKTCPRYTLSIVLWNINLAGALNFRHIFNRL
ncbi:hypothetical protein PHYBLDRAFT_150982 [Phycomyces blakesleeanus NRRL 1555(-)]|uniref:Uncharacterized protein n=1 Tax=Phycomyces blakesleeanus (strain ATCC 8743b / DSM 1359 / FGSC 10004 / NBRC 33097 / NRRL 1555) TaxID=763407 RepID=A0A167KE89_PHYB8|nr:hypothetical protein PHYBLDRAFT_150982 [Phycomyces blakesleeanus NRRL 1555(-)]OAD67895.1 hypothetical protein PHYBLDRAFT_150982 [Phycomyces blakesleeanus NRRL 1555(-)]|eukprot:XP_018285935.1 hypothetical protein PHYBLDRAFT_150982 [Phycomyces blakesleeanus NRRL 1555(-)]